MDEPRAPAPAPEPPKGGGAFLRDLRRIPNLLCLWRMVGIVLGIGIFKSGWYYTGLAVGMSAGLTDYLDGYLARKTGSVTRLGALLDQVADMLFAFMCIILAVTEGLWPLYVLVLWGIRDISVLAMRANAAQQGFDIPTMLLGKVASNFYFWSFVLMVPAIAAQKTGMADHWFFMIVTGVAYFGIHGGLVLQYTSGAFYLRHYIRAYRS